MSRYFRPMLRRLRDAVFVARAETRYYDELKPWIVAAEEARRDRRLRDQVARTLRQQRRTALVISGEHRLP